MPLFEKYFLTFNQKNKATMKKIISTLVVLLTFAVAASAQSISMKVTLNGTQRVNDVNGNEVVLGGVLELPYDAFTSIEYIVQEAKPDERAVDLGLSSGTLWASMNYGATTVKELGTILAFSSLGQISTDSNWGGYWKAPNKSQAQELIDGCDWEPVKENDVFVGYNVYSRENENSIFIPVTKGYYRSSDGAKIRSTTSFYWTSDSDGNKGYALTIADGSSSPAINSYATSGEKDDVVFFYQMAVRPVWVKTPTVIVPSVSFTKPTISEKSDNSAICTFTISGDYDKVTECGICYATSNDLLNSNPQAKTTSLNGNEATVTLSGLTANTTYYVKAYAIVDGLTDTQYSDQSLFTTTEMVIEDYKKPANSQIVNLGLKVHWSPWNMGANKVGDYGKYFQWGALSDEDKFARNVTKGTSIAGNASYDVATEQWGDDWSIPTKAQFEELRDNCTWVETTETDINGNEVQGFRVYGTGNYKNNSIFLPKAGYKNGSVTYQENYQGMYWTANNDEFDFLYAYAMVLADLTANGRKTESQEKAIGFSIRPVYSGTLEEGNGEENPDDDTFKANPNTGAPLEGVDMGTGVKWARWNVGATSFGQKGNYYSWGETDTKSAFSENNYTSELKGQTGFSISYDKLFDNCDVARRLWKGKWRMPTEQEFRSLTRNAVLEWTYDSQKNPGLKITKNGNTIFLQAGGYRESTTTQSAYEGCYWTSEPASDEDSQKAEYWNSSYSNTSGAFRNSERWHGLLVRPVWDENIQE